MDNGYIFDAKAENYDIEFSDSYVGKMQRQRVQRCVSMQLLGKDKLEILELNCGTGEDIPFLSGFGNVTATDVSDAMIIKAAKKNPGIVIEKLDLNELLSLEKKYDVIFSNFGGMNCVSPQRLQELNHELAGILNPGGIMFLVFIHKWSLVEFMYFFLTCRFKKSIRRIRGKAYFGKMPVYYYSLRKTCRFFNSFELVDSEPIGIVFSGEYMNRFSRFSMATDEKLRWLKPLLGADHFLYSFKKPEAGIELIAKKKL